MFLPIEEDETPDKPFRTLFLLHGFEGNQEDWMVHCDLERLARENRLAIVLPSVENSFYQDIPGTGGAFGTFVGQELVNFCRVCFPLSPFREDTWIAGNSMGGFGALLVGSRFSETFSKILALSGAYILDNIEGITRSHQDGIADYDYYARIFGSLDTVVGSDRDPLYWMERALRKKQAPSLFLAVGTEDFLLFENRAMVTNLKRLNAKLTYIEDKGNHNWDFWDKYLKEGIRWASK